MTLVCAAPIVGCGRDEEGAADAGPDAGTIPIGPWIVPAGTTLSRGHFALLSATMDALIPGGPTPGAIECQAPWYLDQLLGAFSVDPPRIFAGGPYSGRHGGLANFAQFQPLTRVERLRWQTYLEGSLGIPEREWNGPVVGLRARYERGLEALDAAAREAEGASFTLLELATRRSVLVAFDASFVQLVYEHAVEGTYGDPVYGGNVDGKGWTAIRYEGDRQPLGYTAEQMLRPDADASGAAGPEKG